MRISGEFERMVLTLVFFLLRTDLLLCQGADFSFQDSYATIQDCRNCRALVLKLSS